MKINKSNKKKILLVCIILFTVILMGLLNFFKKPTSRFVSDQNFQENLEKQMQWTPQTVKLLRESGVTNDKELKLEFFFYTNANEKSQKLSLALQKLNYEVSSEVNPKNKEIFIVTGWTTKMKMDEEAVLKWTKEMVELGYEHDATFDGWGTNPNQ